MEWVYINDVCCYNCDNVCFTNKDNFKYIYHGLCQLHSWFLSTGCKNVNNGAASLFVYFFVKGFVGLWHNDDPGQLCRNQIIDLKSPVSMELSWLLTTNPGNFSKI